MYITTIFREGDYKLVKHEEGRAPYAILKRAEGCWIQVSKWYCSCGWADKKLKQLLKKSKTTEAKK